MTTKRRIKSTGTLAGVLAVVALGCGDTTETSPSQLNLDRPTDMTFACFGGLRIIPDDRPDQTMGDPTDPVIASAQPTTACDIRSGAHDIGTPVPVPPGQEDLSDAGGTPLGSTFWFSFILQGGPGTVAIAEWSTKPSTAFSGGDVNVLDADPLTPGKNSISVGEDPVAIATDRSGCKAITANAGSCDLSVLDVGTAVDLDSTTPIDVRRVDVKVLHADGTTTPVRSRPGAMAAEPAIDVIGKRCPATETGAAGLLYIAYPSCHVVAAVDAATATVVGGVKFDETTGVPSVMDAAATSSLSCPDECSGGVVANNAVSRPVTIDLEKDPRTGARRMVVGSVNSPSLTVVELDGTTTLPVSVSQVALENTTGNLGVTTVAMSPQIGMGGQIHVVNDDNAAGGQFQFVYAIATDDTVRVADILNLRKECDTQIDPRYTRTITSIKDLSCFPVGDPANPPRRAGVRGPGIQLTGDAIPISVDIIKSDAIDGDRRVEEDPSKLIGYFAVIGASNGGVFIANVDDDDRRDLFSPTLPLLTPMPDITAHVLRDGIPERAATSDIKDEMGNVIGHECDAIAPGDSTEDALTGGPRSTDHPQRNVPRGVYADEKVFGLPNFRQIKCEGTDENRAIAEFEFAAPDTSRDFSFPDLAALRKAETWTLTWEGRLSQDGFTSSVDGPSIREGEIHVDSSGMHLVDASRPFCNAGVEPFDIFQMTGCDPSLDGTTASQCPVGYRCFVHPNSQIQGLGACMLADEADRLAEACQDFLTSLRRYTVTQTTAGKIQLLPRRVTLRTTPVEGCTSNTQCQELANYALTNQSSDHPMFDTTAPDMHSWTCNPDVNRAPVATGNRCQMRCDVTSDCTIGSVCQGGGVGSNKAGFCMEGVIPPQSCVNAPQRYELRAGEAFAVLGTLTGFEHPIIADANGKCIRDPNANHLVAGRIPLDPPACDPTADPLSGRKPDGTFEPNPCALTIENTDVVPNYINATCTLDATTPTSLVPRQAPALRYRNRGMNLTIVDPTYPGDANCILDRQGNLGNIPGVFQGYQLAFRQTAGGLPGTIGVPASLPIKVVRGPQQSIWVVDQGDFLSTSVSLASTRGKVFRIEPGSLTSINTLQ